MNITERKPFTPGEILLEEFMIPYGLTQTELANLTRITRRRVNEIINGKRAITIDTALRLSRLFNVSPDYWLNLQIKIDLWTLLHEHNRRDMIQKIKPLKVHSRAV